MRDRSHCSECMRPSTSKRTFRWGPGQASGTARCFANEPAWAPNASSAGTPSSTRACISAIGEGSEWRARLPRRVRSETGYSSARRHPHQRPLPRADHRHRRAGPGRRLDGQPDRARGWLLDSARSSGRGRRQGRALRNGRCLAPSSLRDVPDFALVAGNPARRLGWVCACGARLDDATGHPATPNPTPDASLGCSRCGRGYAFNPQSGALEERPASNEELQHDPSRPPRSRPPEETAAVAEVLASGNDRRGREGSPELEERWAHFCGSKPRDRHVERHDRSDVDLGRPPASGPATR